VPDSVVASTNWHDRCDDRDGDRHHRFGGEGLLGGLLEGLLGGGDDRWDDNCRGDRDRWRDDDNCRGDRDRWGDDDNWRDDRDGCRDEGRHHRHHHGDDDDLRVL
jgi:hypothetical protein